MPKVIKILTPSYFGVKTMRHRPHQLPFLQQFSCQIWTPAIQAAQEAGGAGEGNRGGTSLDGRGVGRLAWSGDVTWSRDPTSTMICVL